uniref:Metalloendopeptidase n=1 Tax=Echeneis naucrates TaxID=173247 RepID=A0A665UC71_ECHNA
MKTSKKIISIVPKSFLFIWISNSVSKVRNYFDELSDSRNFKCEKHVGRILGRVSKSNKIIKILIMGIMQCGIKVKCPYQTKFYFHSISSIPFVEDDVAFDSEAERNADPCTSRGCMWPKSSDGRVYVAYVISSVFSSREVAIIERGLLSFHDVSCIRFVRRTNQRDYLNIQCYSYIGRRNYGQDLSLQRSGCVYHDTVQHEVLHALGFHHEQKRSDRDQYIRIVLDNVISGMEHNFDKVNTLNQGTSYDYGSVMHYHQYAFSKNNQPTLVAIPDPNVQFGVATEMSQKDIIRLNRLYGC